MCILNNNRIKDIALQSLVAFLLWFPSNYKKKPTLPQSTKPNVCHKTEEATGQQAFAKLATCKPFEMGKFKQILFEECCYYGCVQSVTRVDNHATLIDTVMSSISL